MDDEQVWSIYFAGLCHISFHPRNHIPRPRELLAQCADLADAMLEEHHKRWPVETEEPCQPG